MEAKLENKEVIKSKILISACGLLWQNLNVPGEQENKNKGFAYWPHCDGPLFKGKKLAIVNGVNSRIEAANSPWFNA